MNIRIVWILRQQRIESCARLVQATRRHVVAGLSRDQNFFPLRGRNLVRQERHAQDRQAKSLYNFGSFVPEPHELIEYVVRILEVFKANMNECRMIPDNSSQFRVIVDSK